MNYQTNSKHISYRLDIAALMGKDIRCRLNCKYCHKDYFPINTAFCDDYEVSFNDSIEILNSVIGSNSRKIKIHLSGRAEPLDIDKDLLIESIAKLNQSFPESEIVMTSNGYNLKMLAEDLNNAGLRRINVSLHRDFNKSKKVIEGILKAKQFGIKISLNVILSEECLQSLDKILAFCLINNLNLKLFYELGIADEKAIAIINAATTKLDEILHLSPRELDIVRNRLIYKVSETSKVVLKLFEGESDRPENCNSCSERANCLEGCWESIRITPWYIKPCGVREDNVYFFKENSLESLKTKLISGSKLSDNNGKIKT